MKPRLSFLLMSIIAPFLSAQVRLPAIFGSNMVLQQQSQVPIWGWARAGTRITIEVSWTQQRFSARADAEGKWRVILPTPSASFTAHRIRISGGNVVRNATSSNNVVQLENVLIGEVWLCSGQSNMEWTALQGLDNAAEEIAAASHPNLRFFTVEKHSNSAVQDDMKGSWAVSSPETMPKFSSVAYFFGRKLQESLHIPIGLINSSWGGTNASAWTKKAVLNADDDFRTAYLKNVLPEGKSWDVFPTSLYNGMIAPLVPFKLAGVIWYQGESNTDNPMLYRKLFPSMIQNWRSDWHDEFPFYFVQIAPYRYEVPQSAALLREAQLMSLSVPKTGMIVTMDIGNPEDIHPQNKQDVGKRLALWALAKTYNQANIEFSGPLYKQMKIEDEHIRLSFTHFDGILPAPLSLPNALNHFEISGADRIFMPADVKVENSDLLVSNSTIKHPIAVRFAFDNIAVPNFKNSANLPASPFRTDDWGILTDLVRSHYTFDPDAKSASLTLEGTPDGSSIHYTLDGAEPTATSPTYQTAFPISHDTHIKARLIHPEKGQGMVSSFDVLWHKGIFKPITLASPPNPKYDAGGKTGLNNGLLGSLHFTDGNWQGFEGSDMEAVLDLEQIQSIQSIETHFLEAQGSWIFLPKAVTFWVSDDGVSYTQVATFQHALVQSTAQPTIANWGQSFDHLKGRFIKIKAENIGTCPDWHAGRGGKAWVFTDEIVVR
jgi:sialate O-acetylesterase